MSVISKFTCIFIQIFSDFPLVFKVFATSSSSSGLPPNFIKDSGVDASEAEKKNIVCFL